LGDPVSYAFRNTINHGYATNHGNNLFEGNRIGHAEHGESGTSLYGSVGCAWANSNDTIRYNTFFNNGGEAFEFRASQYAASYYTRSNGNYLYNNTFYSNGRNEASVASAAVIYFGWSSDTDLETSTTIYWQATQENVIKNNLFFDNYSNLNNDSVYSFHEANGQSVTEATNCPASAIAGCNVILNNYNDAAGENTDPKFTDTTLTSYTSWTLPDLNLQSDSPVIEQGIYLTQANGANAGESSTALIVDDARYFQDGKFGSASGCNPALWASSITMDADYIAIGTVGNTVQITEINYSTNTITLASAKTWADNASIWLYKDSDGTVVLKGTAPEIGAYEFDSVGVASGTIIPGGCTESEIVSGSKTIVITLSGDEWVAAGATFDAQRQNIINGMDSAQAEAAGWDAVVKGLLPVTAVVRTNANTATITLTDFDGDPYTAFGITANETVTVTIPATAVVGAVEIVATPTFQISAEQISAEVMSIGYDANGPAAVYDANGITITN